MAASPEKDKDATKAVTPEAPPTPTRPRIDDVPAGSSAQAIASVWLPRVRAALYTSVLPFWMEHSVDKENGGFFDCLGRDGKVFDTRKHVWLQGRQVWMLSKICGEHSPKSLGELSMGVLDRGEMAAAALAGARFLQRHARRKEDNQVYFCLTADGKPVQLQRKIFSACFYCLGLGECSNIAAELEGAEAGAAMRAEALEMLDIIIAWSKDPTPLGRPVLEGDTPSSPLNVPMILLNLISELAALVPEGAERDAFHADTRKWCVEEIMRHVKPDLKLVLENVAPDGALIDSPDGRLHTPGHAIEAGWFLMDHAMEVGDDELVARAAEIIDWSYDAGWDDEYGGLYYFLDSSGLSPVPLEWNMKLWWPHCEAMIAYALAYRATGATRHMERFHAVAKYTMEHFADSEHGEWFGYLDRTGGITHTFKGGPYKGCFHVPRALMMCEQILATVAGGGDGSDGSGDEGSGAAAATGSAGGAGAS